MCVLKVPPEDRVSQIFYFGPNFYFMTKTGNFLPFILIQISTFHKIRT